MVLLPVAALGASCVDADRDRDADLADFQGLQICYSGTEVPTTDPCCEPFDTDGDKHVASTDLADFVTAMLGPARPFEISYKLDGIDFSAFINDQDPNRGDTVSEEQVQERLRMIAPYANAIRIFSTTNGHEHAGPLGRELGRRIAAGAWIGRDLEANQREIAGLIDMPKAGYVDITIVGSEALLRRDVTAAQLVDYINQVKAALPGIPVTTADVYSVLLANPAVIEACDVLMVNYYPYWEDVGVECAVASIHTHHQEMLKAAAGKPVIVSETGWPSCGNTNGDAVPSAENARFYFLNFVSWARANKVSYYYFEAFDELWKARYEGPQGACWGLAGECGQLKPWVCDVLAGLTIPDNWSGTQLVGGPGDPAIELTYVPPYGSFDNLRGQVWHVAPIGYKVAVYIYVVGGWWTKPYWDRPLTDICPAGSFVCDITTGGVDQNATRIRAYLVPAGYDPPLMSGQATLPDELEENAVAWVEATRTP